MPINRRAVRAVLLSEQHEILLIHVIEPASQNAFWLLPGGGIEADEQPIEGLQRELLEEVGFSFDIGPQIWHRSHEFSWDGRQILQNEQIFLVPVKTFNPTTINMPDQGEIDSFNGFGWWSLSALEQSTETFVPRELARLLRQLVEAGPPQKSIAIGP